MRHLKDILGYYPGLMIVLFCAGILAAPVAAEEQDGKWVQTDIRYDKTDEIGGDDGCWQEVNSLSSTSSSYIVKQNLCGDNDFADWSSSASWEVPPETLQPGGRVHLSGYIVRNSFDERVTHWDDLIITVFGITSEEGLSRLWEGVDSDPAGRNDVTLEGDFVVPSEGTEVLIKYETRAGTVSYVYAYQTGASTAQAESTPCDRLKVSIEEADSSDGICFLRSKVVELCSGDKLALEGASLEFRIWDEENEDYRDLGPVTTDSIGEYLLEVPMGTWRVDVYASKEGYDEDWTNIYYCCSQGQDNGVAEEPATDVEEEPAIDIYEIEQPDGTDAAGPNSAGDAASETDAAPSNHGELIFSDDFSDMDSGFSRASNDPDLSSMGYEKEKYHILQKKSGQAWSYPPESPALTDFVVEVETSQEDGPDHNQYGLVLRRDSSGNYYCFQISGTGTYRFDKFLDGRWVEIIPDTWTEAINTGNAKNVLGAECDGEDFRFYVNGEKIDEARDSSIPSGRVGLVAGAPKEPNVHIHFDDLKVWALQ